MTTAGSYTSQRSIIATREVRTVTHRGRVVSTGSRVTPDQIYRTAGSRREAVDLLRQHGYITSPARAVAAPVVETAETAAKKLVARATAAEPELTRIVTDLSDKFGGEAVGLANRLKGVESLTRKIQADVAAGEGTAQAIAGKIFDVNRYTIRFPGDYAGSVQSTLDGLRAEGYRLKVKNYWTNTKNPYQGVNVQVTSPTGGQWELQFHTPESLAVKEGEMHRIYEASRVETDPAKIADYTAQSFAAAAKIPVPAGIQSVG